MKHYIPQEIGAQVDSTQHTQEEQIKEVANQKDATEFGSILLDTSESDALISSQSFKPIAETRSSSDLQLMQYRSRKLSASFQQWDHPTK
jgi:hypothetical protein